MYNQWKTSVIIKDGNGLKLETIFGWLLFFLEYIKLLTIRLCFSEQSFGSIPPWFHLFKTGSFVIPYVKIYSIDSNVMRQLSTFEFVLCITWISEGASWWNFLMKLLDKKFCPLYMYSIPSWYVFLRPSVRYRTNTVRLRFFSASFSELHYISFNPSILLKAI